MNKIGIAGDWHGNREWARHALYTFYKAGIKDIYHAGDFGLGWPNPPGRWNQYINEIAGACIRWDLTLWIVPGNHENYDWIHELHDRQDGRDQIADITERIHVMPRGHRFYWADADGDIERCILSVGGAASIDFTYRTQGIDWWAAEVLELGEAMMIAEEGHADVLISHDAPYPSTPAVNRIIGNNPMGWSVEQLSYANEARYVFEGMYKEVRPKVLVHGHFHAPDEVELDGTKILSLGCDRQVKNMITLDLATLEHEWLEIVEEIPTKKEERQA